MRDGSKHQCGCSPDRSRVVVAHVLPQHASRSLSSPLPSSSSTTATATGVVTAPFQDTVSCPHASLLYQRDKGKDQVLAGPKPLLLQARDLPSSPCSPRRRRRSFLENEKNVASSGRTRTAACAFVACLLLTRAAAASALTFLLRLRQRQSSSTLIPLKEPETIAAGETKHQEKAVLVLGQQSSVATTRTRTETKDKSIVRFPPLDPSSAKRLVLLRQLQGTAPPVTAPPTVTPFPTTSPVPTTQAPTTMDDGDDDGYGEPPSAPDTPVAAPQVAPVSAPQAVPQPAPASAPQAAPQVTPQAAPQAPPASLPIIEQTGYPTITVSTDSPTDPPPVAGTFAPTVGAEETSNPTVITESPTSTIDTDTPTAAFDTLEPSLLPTTEPGTTTLPTFPPPSSLSPTPGSEFIPLEPVAESPVVAPEPAPEHQEPTPSEEPIPLSPPPNLAPVAEPPVLEPEPEPTPPPAPEATDPPAPSPVAETEPPTEGETDEPTPEPFSSPQEPPTAPEPVPTAPEPTPSSPSPTEVEDPTPRPRPSPTASQPEPTPRPRPTRRPAAPVAPAPDDEEDPAPQPVRRPSPSTSEPSSSMAEEPPTDTPATGSPTRQDENSATAPVSAPTAALGYSYDMVRVGREGLEMRIALSREDPARRRRLQRYLLQFRPKERQQLPVRESAPPLSRALQQNQGGGTGSGIEDAALCTDVWVKYMQDIIRFSVKQALSPEPVELVDVEIQNVALDRLLDQVALMFFFDVQIRIRSPPREHDVDAYVSSPFDTDKEKQEFVDYLRRTDCKEFQYATSVQLIFPPGSRVTGSASSRPANTGLIVGIVAAAVAFAMLVALYLYMKIRGKRPLRYNEQEKMLALAEEQPMNDFASEVGLRTSADVSTLSDPLPLGAIAAAPASRDGSTAGSFTLDYDFQKAYQASVSETSVGSHHTGDAASYRDYFSTDDGSLEAQYVADEQVEVIAPAGVLGLILETNEDGIPVVNNVKASSVLSGQVQVGDRLLSVDGQDVTVMLASDVSKLIAMKKHKAERRLVFARPSNRRQQRDRATDNNREPLLLLPNEGEGVPGGDGYHGDDGDASWLQDDALAR